MEAAHIERFEELFGLPFRDVVKMEDLGTYSFDDGMYHYVHQATKDVYSFDTDDYTWLEKNEERVDVLRALADAEADDSFCGLSTHNK